MSRFLTTSVAYIGLRQVLIFLALTMLTMGFVYLFEATYIDKVSQRQLSEFIHAAEMADQRGGPQQVLKMLTIQENSPKERGSCYALLLDARGRKLAGRLELWPLAIKPFQPPKLFWTTPGFLTDTEEDEPTYWPAMATVLSDGSRLLVVRHQELGEKIREVAIPTIWLTLLSFTLGAFYMVFTLGMRLLEKVDALNIVLAEFEEGDLSRRVAIRGEKDEFALLGTHLNSLFDRMESLITSLRRVTADVAHDLRSPLARISTRLEVTLLNPQEEKEYRKVLEETLRDTKYLTDTFNSLLYIGQLEAERVPLKKQTLNLSLLVEEMVGLYAEEDDTIHQSIQSEVVFTGERELLQRVLSNLLENAIKFSPEPGSITVLLSRQERFVELVVSDRGIGIPPEARRLVFERFYRLDAARSTWGSGLGLSLVRAAVKAHGGEVILGDNHPGLRVVVRLPL